MAAEWTRAPGSGPAVARLGGALIALNFLIAWLSLGAQIDVLAGSRGLLPAEPFVAAIRAQGLSLLDAPAIHLLIGASDRMLHAGIAVGMVLALLALFGVAPRLCFALGTVLYLSYAVVCRTFLSFQWDNMLLECGLLATLLPRDRRAPWAHLMVRVLLFKLYFESGIAKWGSHLGDWQDGSAMTYYYETAPLPARFAWYAHALPATFHHFESWFTLFFELVLPFAVFGPRRARLAALAIFTLFQVVDVATANYGFFCYLSLALHAFLLDDGDVVRARAWLERRAPSWRKLRVRMRWIALRLHRITARLTAPRAWRRPAAIAAVAGYVVLSFADACGHFSSSGFNETFLPIRKAIAPFRVVNTYHLFAAITRERIEPELETFDGATWTAHDLLHKPGDVMRPPHLVAPHQPRVDFQLWFYGLSYTRGVPPYVGALLDHACHDPGAVAGLFRDPLPGAPKAVRMAFHRYHFTTPEERRATGAWWKRESMGALKPLPCSSGR